MEEVMQYVVYQNGDYYEFLAPSGVTKPTTGLTIGMWTESNTGKVYLYDKTNGWTEQFSLQG